MGDTHVRTSWTCGHQWTDPSQSKRTSFLPPVSGPAPWGPPACLREGPKGSCNRVAGPWRPLGLHRLFLLWYRIRQQARALKGEGGGDSLSWLVECHLILHLETCLRGLGSRRVIDSVTLGKSLTLSGPLSLHRYNDLPRSLSSGGAFPSDGCSSHWVAPPGLQQPKCVFRQDVPIRAPGLSGAPATQRRDDVGLEDAETSRHL